MRSDWDNAKIPDFLYFEVKDNSLEAYHEAFKESFMKASKKDVKDLLKLPNFDYEIFEEISSITKEDIKKKINKQGERNDH